MDSFPTRRISSSTNRFGSSLPKTLNGHSSNGSLTTPPRLSSTSAAKRHFLQPKGSSDMKSIAPEVKSNLTDLKNSITEMKNLNTSSQQIVTSHCSETTRNFNRSVSAASNLTATNSKHHRPTSPSSFLNRTNTSPAIMELPPVSPVESMISGDLEGFENGNNPIITSPVSELAELEFSDHDNGGSLTSPNLVSSMNPSTPTTLSSKMTLANSASSSSFEERKTSTSSKTKIVTDTTSTEKAVANTAQMKRVQTGDLIYEDKSAASAVKSRLEAGGTVAEKSSGMKQQQRFLRTGDMVAAESSTAAIQGSKLQSSTYCQENVAQASSSQRQTMSASGSFSHESHHKASSSKKMSVTSSSGMMRTHNLLSDIQISQLIHRKMSMEEIENSLMGFDDLESLTPNTNVKNVENALVKYCGVLSNAVEVMKRESTSDDSLSTWLAKVNDMMTKAWTVPAFGHEIGNTLCDIMRNNGGLDILIDSCIAPNKALQFNSAKLLQQCLVTENRGYVVDKGLDKVVSVAKTYADNIRDVKGSRVGVGILEHLFKHSETTCSDVIAMGGLDTVVNDCKSTDVETLRHCASALANVAMYGGSENQEAMIKCKVPSWLFPLAFHHDDTIKYYACLAIAALVSNKEIEAAVQKSGALELIEPFVQSHSPAAFAETSATHSHGQSPNWLKRLIPVLLSQREEARNLAAFHFCMEAEIKKQQGKLDLFREIGAIESLRKVASCPNGIASRYAAQTLRLIGEEVPHKLSQQVPTWSVEDVKEWVKQIGFPQFADSFFESRVDGDLLMQLTEDMLKDDIQMRNGILRRRFMRELTSLKRRADYSSCDPSNLNGFLQSLGQEYTVYTYDLLNAGVDRDTLLQINEEVLQECGIGNKIHRIKIQQGVKVERGEVSICDESINKNLDVFISYRRSNGSQLASLLKVHLEIRNYTVFLDVDRLEAGKFDNNLLQSIRSAKNFLLVLTPGALDRCYNDFDQRDWIHKEIACALSSQCNIIPVFDNFAMPESDHLPDSMRAVTAYNGVKWIHDYQEACVDKIDRFIRGDGSYSMMDRFLNSQPGTSSYGGSNGTYNRQNTYQRTISSDSKLETGSDDTTLPASSQGGKD